MPPVPKPAKRAPKARKRPKAKNATRSAREFARCYGSAERVAFVQSLPCAGCGVVGHSQNAHTPSQSGAGRKGDSTTIIPLCGPRPLTRSIDGKMHSWMIDGCHKDFDNCHAILPNFAELAEETERAWQAFSSGRS